MCPLRDCIGNDSIDAENGEQQSETREEDQRGSVELRKGKRSIQPLLHCLYAEYRHTAINRLHSVPDGRDMIFRPSCDPYDERRVKAAVVVRTRTLEVLEA